MMIPPISRREALRKLYQIAVSVGATSFLTFDDLLQASQRTNPVPSVVWLHGSSCTGCTCSLLNIEEVPLVQLITQFMDLTFHPDISSATGEQVVSILTALLESDRKFILLFEGGLPVDLPHACLMADRPMSEWVSRLGNKAEAAIAIGTCAALGGIPKMAGTLTGSHTLSEFFKKEGISTPVINLPTCPIKPEHLVYTLLYYSKFKKPPEMDAMNRPKTFFGKTVHERCIYYADFQEDNFAKRIGEDGCLFKLGCQGPITYNDCLINGFNSNTNICIRAGHPCIGCASVQFPRKIMMHRFDDVRQS
ncbi:MAG: hydrogenase small subunit [bacterium]